MGVLVGIVICLGLFLYFLPSVIAVKRDHPNKKAIFFLNLFTGLAGAGWIAAFIWSCATPIDKNEAALKAISTEVVFDTTSCPCCGEIIMKDAKSCPHCGYENQLNIPL